MSDNHCTFTRNTLELLTNFMYFSVEFLPILDPDVETTFLQSNNWRPFNSSKSQVAARSLPAVPFSLPLLKGSIVMAHFAFCLRILFDSLDLPAWSGVNLFDTL